MTKPQGATAPPEIGPAAGSSKQPSISLPIEFIETAARRFRFLALAVLGVDLGLALLVVILEAAGAGTDWIHGPFSTQRGYSAALSIAVALGAGAMIAVTYLVSDPRRVVVIGVVFQIFVALVLAAGDFVLPWSQGDPSHGIPAVTLWVTAFPLVPATVSRAVVAGMGSAAMGPISYGLAFALGRSVPDAKTAIAFYLPLFVAAAMACLSSVVIHRLAVDVSRARRLGAYQLVELVAKGGIGEIWRARHGSLIRPAAIKILRPELIRNPEAADAAYRRFEREAQSTALLSSPHTVVLYDFGRTGDGTIYYVMELLGGLDLDELVRKFGPMPAERVTHVLRQICHSLSEAHALGLVHRDIKPANVRLTVYGGEYDYVKVLDFGLVKLHNGPADPLVSSEATVAGTPAFLAPEQATSSHAVDGRTDLYALGCVGYWLLTGQLVFEASTPMAMMVAHARDVPVPPSQRTELPVPPELDRLILSLLAKEPTQRPTNAAEVSRQLESLEGGQPWNAERAERWWRAHVPGELLRNLRDSGLAAVAAEGLALPAWPTPGRGSRPRLGSGPSPRVQSPSDLNPTERLRRDSE